MSDHPAVHDVSVPCASGWVAHPVSVADPRACLVVLPCAGGGPASLRPPADAPGLDVWPIQPPGHGARLTEPPLTTMAAIVDCAFEEVLRYARVPVALFGHSLGALVALEIARRIDRRGTADLLHLFVAGCRPPHCRRGRAHHEMPWAALRQEIAGLNGAPVEILGNDDLAPLFEPVLRAELRVYWDYVSAASADDAAVRCDITALGGVADAENTEPLLREWRRYTTGACHVRMFDGGHFFVDTSRTAVTASVMSTLSHIMNARCEVRA